MQLKKNLRRVLESCCLKLVKYHGELSAVGRIDAAKRCSWLSYHFCSSWLKLLSYELLISNKNIEHTT